MFFLKRKKKKAFRGFVEWWFRGVVVSWSGSDFVVLNVLSLSDVRCVPSQGFPGSRLLYQLWSGGCEKGLLQRVWG
jgi:hypothetical protein